MQDSGKLTPKDGLDERENARRFLFSFGLTSFSLLALTAALNAYFDPYGISGSGRYPIILLPHQTFALKERLIAHLKAPVEVLISGASEVLKVDPDEISRRYSRSTFNAATADGSLGDSYEIIRTYFRKFPDARTSVLLAVSLDEVVGPGSGDHSLAPRPVGSEALPWIIDYPERKWSALVQLLDLRELAFSFLYLRGLVPDSQVTFTKLGFREHDRWDRIASDPALRNEWEEEQLDTRRHFREVFPAESSLNPASLGVLAKILGLAKAQRIPISVVLNPVQPSLLYELRAGSFEKNRRSLVSWLTAHGGQESQLRVLDFTEIRSFGGENEEFFDGVHMKSANISALLVQWRARGAI